MVNRNKFTISGSNLDNSRISGNSFNFNKDKNTNHRNTNHRNTNYKSNNLSSTIHHIKRNIISEIMIHYYRKNFDSLKNHLLLKENYINQINIICKDNLDLKNEFEPYIILMDTLEDYMKILKKVDYLEDLTIKKSKSNINNIVYTFSELKIKTEYEIYNVIYGKPNIKSGENYDGFKITKIKRLLNDPKMTFGSIEKIMHNS